MVRLYDLGSANGTYVNDEQIQAVSLSHFSEFRIGSTTLVVTIVSKHSNETTRRREYVNLGRQPRLVFERMVGDLSGWTLLQQV